MKALVESLRSNTPVEENNVTPEDRLVGELSTILNYRQQPAYAGVFLFCEFLNGVKKNFLEALR
jgi:hypothetical protein